MMRHEIEKPIAWVLEDTELFAQMLSTTLSDQCEVEIIPGIEALILKMNTTKVRPQILIADLILSDGNFLDFIHSATWQRQPISPFIVISGMPDIELTRQCMENGAQDFIVKPYHAAEVRLKVELALSRHRVQAAEALLDGHSLEQIEHGNICLPQKDGSL